MTFRDQIFKGEDIVLDFHTYERCRFERCRVTYLGYGAYNFNGCEFDECEWGFQGPSLNTLRFLSAVYRSGSPDARALVDQTLEGVQRGRY